MIIQVYNFTPGAYVIAEHWNSNFTAIKTMAEQHSEAITDAYNLVAFPNSDMTSIFARVDEYFNSYQFTGTNLSILRPNTEYWENRLEAISQDQQLIVRVGNINGESRVFFQTSDTRDVALPPVLINYDGGSANIDFIDDSRVWVSPGIKCLLFYELNGRLNVKMIKAA